MNISNRMHSLHPILCVLLLIIFLSSKAQPQRGDTAKDSERPVMTVRTLVPEVDLSFTIRDRHGHAIPDLRPEQISILDNGRPPAKLTYFTSQGRVPLKLALVLDRSDSVHDCFSLEKSAAMTVLKKIMHSGSDLGLIIGFNQSAYVAQSPTADRTLLFRAIKELPGGGNTAIYDAVALASRELGRIGQHQPSLGAIILMTDGEDNSSQITLHDAEQIARQAGVLVYTLFLADSAAHPGADRNLKSLSENTGAHSFIADQSSIDAAMSHLRKELRSQYAVGYKPDDTRADGSFHWISVKVPNKLRAWYFPWGYIAR